jgi:predicted RecB family nuclease
VQILDGEIVLSATDLVGHLACEHLTTLEVGAARGDWRRPMHRDPELDLLQKKGLEHESRYLAHLEAQGRSIARPLTVPIRSRRDLLDAETRTVAAMRSGADVIYQATLFDGRWRGHPDFLIRVDRPSGLGEWSYEPADAKLARHVKAAALVQLCFYADRLGTLQGYEPEGIVVITGDGETQRHRLRDYSAYYRVSRRSFEEGLGVEGATYPNPVDHCRVCRWYGTCADRRRDDDHLSRVANLTRGQTKKLVAAGIPTLDALASSPDGMRIPAILETTVDRLRRQARLQQLQYADGVVRHELITPDPADPSRGLALLPEPSPGDVFFDLENDPWAGADGLEYLFGFVVESGGGPAYTPLWAHSAEGEKRAVEQFLDFVAARRREHPTMHVYHYGAYEEAALKRLVARHGTRTDDLDELLRADVLVDLLAVVRQGMRVSQESYSLKKVEKLYMPDREGPVTRAGFSVVEYERWLDTRDTAILDGLAAYNRDDCVSTYRLRTWLEERRREFEARFGITPQRPTLKTATASEEMTRQGELTRAQVYALLAGVPSDRRDRTGEQHARSLLAHLLDWHRREAKPEWWRHFDLREKPMDELVDSPDALAYLDYVGIARQAQRSFVYRYRHDPQQEHKFKPGDHVFDPATKRSAGEVVAVDLTEATIDLKRGKTSKAPHPRALVPAGPVQTNAMRDGLRRVAAHVIENGIAGPGPYQAVRDLLLRMPPRVQGVPPGAPLTASGENPLAAAVRLVSGLDASYLPLQGPPGSGKTFTGARMIVDLLKAGRKVGITASAHKAITNLVDEVCRAAREQVVRLRVGQRAEEEDGSHEREVTVADATEDVVVGLIAGQFNVVAGTPWLFARDDMEGRLDVLFVDEAGQMSLANVVAMGGAARSIVLLGDPNQLPQVTKGTHPEGAGASALEHVLGEVATIAPHEGLLLPTTWRLAPEICTYVSDAFYDSRLEPHESTRSQVVATGPILEGAGLRFLPCRHAHNSSHSPEECAVVADVVAALLGRPWSDRHGVERPLTLDDILVVAPYNLQVGEIARTIRARFGRPGRVGTVDKFQGQEGAIVLYSTATSSADDAPRDLEFLYSRHRLNVAVSRARALAVLVCSPDLFRIRCKNQMDLMMANAFCLLLERSKSAT